jgi:hypothetical protein
MGSNINMNVQKVCCEETRWTGSNSGSTQTAGCDINCHGATTHRAAEAHLQIGIPRSVRAARGWLLFRRSTGPSLHVLIWHGPHSAHFHCLASLSLSRTTIHRYVGFEVLTEVVITPCSPLKVNRVFEGTCSLHLKGLRISRARNQRERRCFLSKRWFNFNGLHGVLSQKIVKIKLSLCLTS